jgi:hypothetical protein
MRILFLLILLAGTGLGILYPWAVTNFSGSEIGTWRVYQRGSGFKPVTTRLSSADAPVRVLVDMTALKRDLRTQVTTRLRLMAESAGRTVLAATLNFQESRQLQDGPHLPTQVYRDEAGVLPEVESGDYTFTVGPGDVADIEMQSVDLILRAGAGGFDERAQPLGFTLMAIGFIGLVLALRRGKDGGRPPNPNSQPPPPRWGRGGEVKKTS